MKVPTRKITVIDYDAVMAALLDGTVVYECTFDEGKSINNAIRRMKDGAGISMKAHTHDINGNVLSYRFNLTKAKRRT